MHVKNLKIWICWQRGGIDEAGFINHLGIVQILDFATKSKERQFR
jgi:hypothetical protein